MVKTKKCQSIEIWNRFPLQLCSRGTESEGGFIAAIITHCSAEMRSRIICFFLHFSLVASSFRRAVMKKCCYRSAVRRSSWLTLALLGETFPRWSPSRLLAALRRSNLVPGSRIPVGRARRNRTTKTCTNTRRLFQIRARAKRGTQLARARSDAFRRHTSEEGNKTNLRM